MRGMARLAIKNLGRYRKRTMLTSLALGMGLGIFIWMDAWLLGAELESERNLVWYETASLRVVAPDYDIDTPELKTHVADADALAHKLRAAGYRASPRLQFGGEMIFYQGDFPADGYLPVRIIAIDMVHDKSVYELMPRLSEGVWPEAGSNGLVMGEWLARDIGATIGATVIVETKDLYGRSQTLDLRISGLVRTDNPAINRASLYISLDLAQEALDMAKAAGEIDIALDDYRQEAPAAINLEKFLADSGVRARVLTWRDLAADYLAISSSKQGGSKVMLIVVTIIAAVGISNTMLMAVFERMKELGMLQAMGMTVAEIRRLFLYESAGIGAVGALIGLVIGTCLTIPMVIWGIDFSFLLKDMDIGYRIAGVMKAAWNPQGMVTALVFAVVLAVAVARLSLGRMLRLSITDCLSKGA